MKLSEWVQQFPTQRAAASSLGLRAPDLCRYLKGRTPDRQRGVQIVEASGGQITLADLGLDYQPRWCASCSAPLTPRRDQNGGLFLGKEWAARKYCNARCMGDAMVVASPSKPTIRKRAYLATNVRECSRCGSSHRVQRHHPDYAKPLEVVPLCQSCHAAEHVQAGTWGSMQRSGTVHSESAS